MAKSESIRQAFYRLHEELLAMRCLVDAFRALDQGAEVAWIFVVEGNVARLEVAARLLEELLNAGGSDGEVMGRLECHGS